jgi:hypothetical protein
MGSMGGMRGMGDMKSGPIALILPIPPILPMKSPDYDDDNEHEHEHEIDKERV